MKRKGKPIPKKVLAAIEIVQAYADERDAAFVVITRKGASFHKGTLYAPDAIHEILHDQEQLEADPSSKVIIHL